MKTKLSMEVGNYVFVKPTSFQFLFFMILDGYYKVFLGKTIVQFIEIGLSQTTPCMGIYSGNACGLWHTLHLKTNVGLFSHFCEN
jgi:hypothetical protein